MSSETQNRHPNYEVLNLIGYGLAKFDMLFVREFGFKTKSAFYKYVVQIGAADTVGTVKNRQDLFDPFFDNKRKGWWQKGNAYIHRKLLIDSLFDSFDANAFAKIVKLYIDKNFVKKEAIDKEISPIVISKFKQLQVTGHEAELFFISNYQQVHEFREGILEDARLFGDGYDFQIEVNSSFFLAEVKGLQTDYGSIRLTQNEFLRAKEYKNDYALVVISSLSEIPKMNVTFNPVEVMKFTSKVIESKQISYHSESLKW